MNEINDNNYMQWVERFLDAETTLNQERELYAYFSRSNLPEGARRYREMFGWYEDMQTPTPASSQSSPVRLLPLRMWQWVSVAAIIVLLFAAGLMLRPSATGNEYIGDDGYIYSGYMIRDGKKSPTWRLSRLRWTVSIMRLTGISLRLTTIWMITHHSYAMRLCHPTTLTAMKYAIWFKQHSLYKISNKYEQLHPSSHPHCLNHRIHARNCLFTEQYRQSH